MGLFSSLFVKKKEKQKVEENKTMSKVLFVKANDRPAEQAVSSKMYETFVSTYKEANPKYRNYRVRFICIRSSLLRKYCYFRWIQT